MNDYIELRVDLTPVMRLPPMYLPRCLPSMGMRVLCLMTVVSLPMCASRNSMPGVLRGVIDDMPFEGITADTRWSKVEGRDWNAEWEKNYFHPINIDGRCVIHSSFHTDIPEAEYDIVIDPKMAFGTGHHQTTTLIIRHLLASGAQRQVGDRRRHRHRHSRHPAAMRGATQVHAIEIDEFAHVNAVENVALNGHPEIDVILGDASSLAPLAPADILLANINRNIILNDLDDMPMR